MASKSKKRRRVFRASCILAALIIAGSSFAWFTSRDEVTNRLSASGDYDVSIVESFAPPAKWLPGQEVNKDVYAVNTGNVEAFVKETVTGVLTITTEEAYKPETTPTKPDADSIKLSPAERYVVEAGAFLVYKPTGSQAELGKEVIAMSPDPRQTEDDYTSASATDFTPDVEGLYIFRRTIGVNHDTKLEEFTYDAYYFVPGVDGTKVVRKVQKTNGSGEPLYTANNDTNNPKAEVTLPDGASVGTGAGEYSPVMIDDDHETTVPEVPSSYYKVGNLSVVPEKAYFAGDTDQNDGILATTPPPTYDFYKDVTKTVVPELEYDADNNRLIATYNTGAKTKSELEGLAKAYENAAIAYEDALEEYRAAIRDESTANTTAGTDKAALLQAIAELQTTQKALDDAETALKAAQDEKERTAAAKQAATTAHNKAVADKNTAEQNKTNKTAAQSNAADAVTAAEQARNTARGDRTTAQNALSGVPTNSRAAYLAYFKGLTGTGLAADATDEQVETYLLSLSYDDLLNYGSDGIDNPNDVKWEYYQKLVALKDAEKTLAEKQRLLDQANAAKADADQDLEDATNAYNEAVAEEARTQAALTAATTADDAAAAGVTSKEGLRDAAKDARDQDVIDLANAQDAYNQSLQGAGGASDNVKNAANKLAKAKQKMDDTWNAYKNADDADTGKIRIFINLADVTTTGGVADKWQLLPESLEDRYVNATTAEYATTTPTPAADNIKDTASFYYTSILGGGETSAKLIDSVVLDSAVTQDMFKYFDYDLNVTLNSSQVNIDNNGNYTAETALSELGKYAVLTDNTSADTAITWSNTATLPAAAATPKTYQGKDADDHTYNITELNTPKTIDYSEYTYELTDSSGNKYYANSVGTSTTFYKYDPATGKLLSGTGNEITLNSTATRTNHIRTVTFKNATDIVADKTAEYVYTTEWTGTAPAGATKFCATNSETGGDWKTDIAEVLGAAPATDDTKTIYYKTE